MSKVKLQDVDNIFGEVTRECEFVEGSTYGDGFDGCVEYIIECIIEKHGGCFTEIFDKYGKHIADRLTTFFEQHGL